MIDSSLQVLVEQSFQLFILLIQQTSLFDQVLSVNEKCVVLSQSFVKSSPDGEAFVGKNFGHSLPEHFLFPLLSFLLLLLSLEIGFLFQGWVATKLLVVKSLFTSEVEFLEDFNGVVKVKVWVVSLLFFKFIVFIFDRRNFWWRGVLRVFAVFLFLCLIFFDWSTSILLALLLFFSNSPCFFLLDKLLLLFRAKFVKSINKELDIVHRFDTKRFSNRINFDQGLVFLGFAFAHDHSFFVNQERCLVYKNLKAVFDFMEILFDI